MLIDATLAFVAPGSPQTLTTTAASTNSIDLAVAQDLGIGIRDLPIAVYVGTALTGGTSVNVQLQSSIDNSTWFTIIETGAIAAAQLIANAKIALTLQHRQLAGATNLFPPLHRYLQLNFVVVGTFSAGNIAYAGILAERDDSAQTLGLYKAGYVVAS